MANNADMTASRAIVASAPFLEGHVPGSNWILEEIPVPNALKDGELLIDMAATGICQTDLSTTATSSSVGFPVN